MRTEIYYQDVKKSIQKDLVGKWLLIEDEYKFPSFITQIQKRESTKYNPILMIRDDVVLLDGNEGNGFDYYIDNQKPVFYFDFKLFDTKEELQSYLDVVGQRSDIKGNGFWLERVKSYINMCKKYDLVYDQWFDQFIEYQTIKTNVEGLRQKLNQTIADVSNITKLQEQIEECQNVLANNVVYKVRKKINNV